jgi:hypothetical protein
MYKITPILFKVAIFAVAHSSSAYLNGYTTAQFTHPECFAPGTRKTHFEQRLALHFAPGDGVQSRGAGVFAEQWQALACSQ